MYNLKKVNRTIFMETYLESYKRLKRTEQEFKKSVLNGVVNMIECIHVNPIKIGNMEYSVCKNNRGEKVPAYRYLADKDAEFKPIYDEEGMYEFGWTDFEDCCRIFDLISKNR